MEVKLIQLGYFLQKMLLKYLQHPVFLHVDEKHLHPSGCIDQLLWKIFCTVVYLHMGQKHHHMWLRLHQLISLLLFLLRLRKRCKFQYSMLKL
uniref:Uncharacterized protein n=1 Tax=Arundo donax TaxID=35708 RepID=A0A0A9H1Z7_ARUDO